MNSIKSRLILSGILVSLLVALVAAIAVRGQLDTAEIAAKREAEHMATALAYGISTQLTTKDKMSLQKHVEGLHLIQHRDIVIVDLGKIAIADSELSEIGRAYQNDKNNEVGQTLHDGQPRHFVEVSAAFPLGIKEIVVPIRLDQTKIASPIVGGVIMEYTPIHRELEGIARARNRVIVTAAAVCVVLALLASLMVARRIARPLNSLTLGVAKFASGNFDAKVDVGRLDEIGALAKAFNEMAVALKESQNKLLAHGRDLESKIAERTAELLARNREITLFSKFNDFLQASETEVDAYAVICKTATQLFPEDSGALFVMNASRNMVEATATWGWAPPTNVAFPPADCWALRRGQDYLALGNDVRCRHVAEHDHMYACLPLVAQGETLGILYVSNGTTARDESEELRMMETFRLARNFAENIGLAIANLKLKDAMRNMSIRDPLTGLFNRRYAEESLVQELVRAKRQSTQLALLMLDIDHFKQFNDNFGHDGGDAILRELGEYLKKQVRGSDVICRYGGEEFLLLLSATTTEGARLRAEHLRDGVKLLSVRHAGENMGMITMSIGMAIFPQHATEPAELLKAADVALYQAKQGGRDRVVVYSA